MKSKNNSKEKYPLGKALIARRQELNLSQKDTAEKLNISLTVYAGLEQGSYKANLKLLTALSIFLDKTLSETFQLYLDK